MAASEPLRETGRRKGAMLRPAEAGGRENGGCRSRTANACRTTDSRTPSYAKVPLSYEGYNIQCPSDKKSTLTI